MNKMEKETGTCIKCIKCGVIIGKTRYDWNIEQGVEYYCTKCDIMVNEKKDEFEYLKFMAKKRLFEDILN